MSDDSRAWKDQYMLRFPEGMRERLKEAAAGNNRSMNAEIVARLEESFGRISDERIIMDLPKELLDRIGAAAKHGGDSPTDLIRWTLQDAYPAPPPSPPTLIDLANTLRAALQERPAWLPEEDIPVIQHYLEGVDLLAKADPASASKAISIGMPLAELSEADK